MGLFNFFKKEDSVKKQNLQHLANLFYIALADGEICDSEQKKINEIRERMGVSESEYNDLIEKILDGSYGKNNIISPSSDDEAFDQIRELASLVVEDGKIDDKEIEVLKMLSTAMGFEAKDNELIKGLEAFQENFNAKNEKTEKEDEKNTEHENVMRVNWEEMEDVGVITHYKDKPFTGVAFDLHENGNVLEEMEMLEGLKHGKQVYYSEDSSVEKVSYYENDLRIGHDEYTYDKVTNEIFPDDKYDDMQKILFKIGLLMRLEKSQDEEREIKQFSEAYYEAFSVGIVDSMKRLNKFSEKAIDQAEEMYNEMKEEISSDSNSTLTF
jgi:antitoxin component YwqK of YwqJK toxin-antitoxin module